MSHPERRPLRRRAVGAVALLVGAAGLLAATIASGRWPSHAPDLSFAGRARPSVRTELYFGSARAATAAVSDAQWQAFVDERVTRRFPEGFTVLPAEGQFRAVDGQIRRERAHVLVLVHPRDALSERGIEDLRREYRQLFEQTSVLRVDSAVLAEF